MIRYDDDRQDPHVEQLGFAEDYFDRYAKVRPGPKERAARNDGFRHGFYLGLGLGVFAGMIVAAAIASVFLHYPVSP